MKRSNWRILTYIVLMCVLQRIWAAGTEGEAGPSNNQAGTSGEIDHSQRYHLLQEATEAGQCRESELKDITINDKIYNDAINSIYTKKAFQGNKEDISFHALLLDKKKLKPGMGKPGMKKTGPKDPESAHEDFEPDYAEIRKEAKTNTISLGEDGIWKNEHLLNAIGPNDKIYLVVHGWTDSIDTLHLIYGTEWTLVVGAEWRHYGYGHVFIVDWRVHATTHYLVAAKHKIHQVADVIIAFLLLIYHHLQLRHPDLIMADFFARVEGAGHSLGAQILGDAGHKLRTIHKVRIGKIYGLDPAGYLFTFSIVTYSNDQFFHLNKNCAIIVITLHTEMKELGMSYAIGKYSFFVFVFGDDWCDDPEFRDSDKASCKHQRVTNIFVTGMKPPHETDTDQQLLGFKCSEGVVDRTMTSLFGIHHVDVEGHEGVYYLPIPICSPYDTIPDKINTVRLPTSCTITRKPINFLAFISPVYVDDVSFGFD